MVKILLASHGNLSAGMLSSVELILGKQDNIEVLCAYVDGENDVAPRIKRFVENISPDEQWIVMTDLFGGSVNNEFMNYVSMPNLMVVAGMSLPLVIAAVSCRSITDHMEEIAAELKAMVPDTVHFCSEINFTEETTEDEDF